MVEKCKSSKEKSTINKKPLTINILDIFAQELHLHQPPLLHFELHMSLQVMPWLWKVQRIPEHTVCVISDVTTQGCTKSMKRS